jgi:acyl carrier protein
MTKEEVFAGLKEILAVIRPNTDLSKADYDTELVRELGIDSLTMLLLSLAVEEKFKMKFPDGQAVPATVGEVCESVLKELA